MDKLTQLKNKLKSLEDLEKAKTLSRFFKTGKGEYGEGDRFLGITVPAQRKLAKEFVSLELSEIEQLLASQIHEHRLTALLILTYQFPKANAIEQAEIVRFYLAHTQWINNWDLVDVSCRPIVGVYLLERDRSILYEFAHSQNLWQQRIAIITTGEFIKYGQFTDTIAIAEILLHHSHDLIHKAVGWMLREVGKKERPVLEAFLNRYASQMPRTMLRYAIEHFNDAERKSYLHLRNGTN
ncbi:DNA alkylation repair protein [Tumidithrix elongata RA019]|uniref:DNA alkylation repair protein n=1 Tax=Tumidithrix elongata BACA0141 TaxID=2716417 RepID=A0AAW9Q577_9CYAN|nr:DNA alkylation repair protein [Tumidithrix elongata RA019]